MAANAMLQIKASAIRPGDPRYEEARKIWVVVQMEMER